MKKLTLLAVLILALGTATSHVGCAGSSAAEPGYNLGVVSPGKIFRSEIPDEEFIRTMKRRHGLRSIVYVHNKKKPEYLGWLRPISEELDIDLQLDYSLPGKYPKNFDDVVSLLRFIADEKNQPVLLHCHGGEHRTGMLGAIIRKKQGWSEKEILQEYLQFADDEEGLQRSHALNVVWLVDFFRLRMDMVEELEFPPA